MNRGIPDGIISGYGPPILPVEVEERIIDVIAARAQHSDDSVHDSSWWMRTLLSCSLTCRAWVPRCRRHLFKVVYISSIDSLSRLANHVSSDPFFVPSHVLELKVHSSDVPSNDKNAVTPFHHLVPHYLASKLPEVIYLEFIQADGSNPAHIFHPSFFCQASHFRNVSELWISNYRFPCLADLRRFLAALRALTKVFLTDVLWQNDSAPPTQIPRSTKWKLAHMELYNCQLLSSAFYFWIVPRREVTGTRDHRVPDDDFHPGLFLRDTLIMGQCLQLIRQPDGNGENFELEWLLVSGLGPWVLKCVLREEAGPPPQVLLDLRWIRTPEPIPPSLRDICQTQSRIGLIWKLRLNYDPKSWPMIFWNKLDSLLFQFEHLECVEIHLHSLAYVLGREDEGCLKAAKAIAPGLQTTREKCGLKVYIEDVEILWKGTNEHQ